MQEENNLVEKEKLALVGYIAGLVSDQKMGHLGIGLHGYLVTDIVAKRGYGLKNIIPSPLGYVRGEKGDLKMVDSVFDGLITQKVPLQSTSTNCCLIVAATHLLNLAIERDVKSVFIGTARVQLGAAMAKGFKKLRDSGFKDSRGVEVPYAEELHAFLRAFDLLTEKGITITVEVVEDTNMGVMAAQGLADLAFVSEATEEYDNVRFSLVGADGYWNHNHGRHPLLSHPRLLFTSGTKHAGLPEYLYTMDYEKSAADRKDDSKVEIEVGQSLAHARYAVVRPLEKDPLLERVVDRHRKFHRLGHSNLAVAYLSAVYSKQGHALIERFGTDVLANTTHLTELVDGRGVIFTHDMPIPRKSLRAAHVFTQMENALQKFEECYANNPGDDHYSFECDYGVVMATDISEELLRREDAPKGKVLLKPNKAIELPNITLTVNARLTDEAEPVDLPIKMTIGYDMPTRNTIAALLDEDFKAFILVYRETELTVRHMVAIFSSKGVGIWTTPFAARTFTLKRT